MNRNKLFNYDKKEDTDNLSPLTLRMKKAIELFNDGKKLFELGDYNLALKCFKDSIRLNVDFNPELKNSKIIYHIFRCHVKLGQYADSSKYLFNFTTKLNKNELSYFENGLLKLSEFLRENASDDKSFLIEALGNFSKSVTIDSEDPDNWYYMGYCKMLLGFEKEAIKDFKMTILLNNNYKNVHDISVFENIKKANFKN